MTIEIRFVGEDEHEPLIKSVSQGFGTPMDDDDILAAFKRPLKNGRSVAGYDGSDIVGGFTVFPLDMNVPEGRRVHTAVVSNVAVLPTHRRRGILTRMMDCQMRAARERGESVAILGASESIIYGRYGYGIAAQHERWGIDRVHTAMQFAPTPTGSLRFINMDGDKEAAQSTLMDVATRACADRPAFVPLREEHWGFFMADLELERNGASAMSFVLYEEDGQANGYVIYRLRERTVIVIDLMAVTETAYTALWQFCFGIDLRNRIESHSRPVDDPLPWMLADPRRLERAPYDGMWLRIVDAPAALEARDYAVEGRVVFDVVDDFCTWNSGRFALEAGQGGATCKPTTAAADVTLPAASLAAIYMGGAELSVLARASRAEVASPGVAHKVDAMFKTRLRAWWPHEL